MLTIIRWTQQFQDKLVLHEYGVSNGPEEIIFAFSYPIWQHTRLVDILTINKPLLNHSNFDIEFPEIKIHSICIFCFCNIVYSYVSLLCDMSISENKIKKAFYVRANLTVLSILKVYFRNRIKHWPWTTELKSLRSSIEEVKKNLIGPTKPQVPFMPFIFISQMLIDQVGTRKHVVRSVPTQWCLAKIFNFIHNENVSIVDPMV